MQQHESLKEHYRFTKEEALILETLQPRMSELAEDFINEFQRRINPSLI